MNYFGVKAILIHELDRFKRTLLQSLASPIITTSLYFIVFGTAIGSRIKEIDGINYGSYIVPGMIMLTILTQALSNASFAIYFQKFTSTIYEIDLMASKPGRGFYELKVTVTPSSADPLTVEKYLIFSV